MNEKKNRDKEIHDLQVCRYSNKVIKPLIILTSGLCKDLTSQVKKFFF